MKTVNVQFVNFWKGFQLESYVFLGLLQKRFKINLVNSNPDVVFFAQRISNNPKRQLRPQEHTGIKVYYTGEDTVPDMSLYDYSFTHQYTTETNFQLLNFMRCKYFFDFVQQTEPNHHRRQPKTKFCNFIYRNQQPQERIQFCNQLQTYKHVDCPGAVLNNMPNSTPGRRSPSWLAEKIDQLAKYKFTIAFENTSNQNWITEKVFDAFYTGSIPIYWGAPNITEFFNPESFINVHDFDSVESAIEYVERIDSDAELYKKMRLAPILHEGSKLRQCTEEAVLNRFNEIVKKATS